MFGVEGMKLRIRGRGNESTHLEWRECNYVFGEERMKIHIRGGGNEITYSE